MTLERHEVDERKKEMLEHFVQEVLNHSFPNDPIKRIIDASEGSKINFACPFCGDSQKRASKKRGNLFLETSTYKCFNDGCNTWMPIRKFVSTFMKKFGIQIDIEMFGGEIDAEITSTVKAKASGNPLINFLLMPKDNLVSMEDILNRFPLIRADELPEESVVRQVLESRFVHQTPDYGDFFYGDSRDNKFYIFNLGAKSGKILGFAVRSLEKDTDRKYIIRNYVDLMAAFPDKKITPELQNEVDTFNNYFNILNLNFQHPITVVEGQVDSRFVYNCLSTTGVSKSLAIIGALGPKKNIRILFDRDKAGKTEMIKLIEQGYSVFLWNPMIEALKKKWHAKEDIMQLSKDELKDVNDLYKFLAKRQEIDFTIFNEFIVNYFSTSVYDIMAI